MRPKHEGDGDEAEDSTEASGYVIGGRGHLSIRCNPGSCRWHKCRYGIRLLHCLLLLLFLLLRLLPTVQHITRTAFKTTAQTTRPDCALTAPTTPTLLGQRSSSFSLL